MVQKRFLCLAALASGFLSLCACTEIDRPDDGTAGTETPGTPAGDYFRLMINLSTEVPDNHEVVFNTDATGTNFIVQTNLESWDISSDAEWCRVEKTEETPSSLATAVILVDDYDGVAARICSVRVKAGTLFDKTIRVVQQGNVFFYYTDDFTWNLSLFSYMLGISSAGEEKDAHIITNCYRWVPTCDASWLTVSRKDQVTLHLISQPASAGEGTRSAKVTITDTNDDFKSISFTVMDNDGLLSGYDYDYDDTEPWD